MRRPTVGQKLFVGVIAVFLVFASTFIVYQQADGTVSAYLDSAERGSISKRGTPPAT